MREIERIRQQLERAWQGPAWHGPAVREILAGLTAGEAAARPVANAHSIWEIVLHVGVWEDAVRRRTAGEEVDPSPAEDWPAVTKTSPAAWEAALEGLERGHRALAEAVASVPEERLAGPVPGCDYELGFMLHGVIQHDLYHAGQIALLRKAAGTRAGG